MPRHLPNFPAHFCPPVTTATDKYKIELITPLFGGGVQTQTNDETFPVRPTAIRGHLRYWWRVLSGNQLEVAGGVGEKK